MCSYQYSITMYTDTDISYLLLAPILYGVPLEKNNAKNRRIIFWIMYIVLLWYHYKKLAGQMCEPTDNNSDAHSF